MMYDTGMLLNFFIYFFFFAQLSCDSNVSESGFKSDYQPGPIMLRTHKLLSCTSNRAKSGRTTIPHCQTQTTLSINCDYFNKCTQNSCLNFVFGQSYHLQMGGKRRLHIFLDERHSQDVPSHFFCSKYLFPRLLFRTATEMNE